MTDPKIIELLEDLKYLIERDIEIRKEQVNSSDYNKERLLEEIENEKNNIKKLEKLICKEYAKIKK